MICSIPKFRCAFDLEQKKGFSVKSRTSLSILRDGTAKNRFSTQPDSLFKK